MFHKIMASLQTLMITNRLLESNHNESLATIELQPLNCNRRTESPLAVLSNGVV